MEEEEATSITSWVTNSLGGLKREIVDALTSRDSSARWLESIVKGVLKEKEENRMLDPAGWGLDGHKEVVKEDKENEEDKKDKKRDDHQPFTTSALPQFPRRTKLPHIIISPKWGAAGMPHILDSFLATQKRDRAREACKMIRFKFNILLLCTLLCSPTCPVRQCHYTFYLDLLILC